MMNKNNIFSAQSIASWVLVYVVIAAYTANLGGDIITPGLILTLMAMRGLLSIGYSTPQNLSRVQYCLIGLVGLIDFVVAIFYAAKIGTFPIQYPSALAVIPVMLAIAFYVRRRRV